MALDPNMVLTGVQVGLKAMEAWNEYIARLYAKQQERVAKGETLTMTDVMAELDAVNEKVNANTLKIAAKKAAQEAS